MSSFVRAVAFLALTLAAVPTDSQTIGPQIETTLNGGGAGPMILDERRGVFYLYDCTAHSTGLEVGVQVRDRSTGALIQLIPTYCGGGSTFERYVAMDASAERLYVNDGDGSSLDIVDLNSRQMIGFVQGLGFDGVSPVAINPTTGLVYQASGSLLGVFDPRKSVNDPARITTVPDLDGYLNGAHLFDFYVASVAANPNTNLLYLAGMASDNELRVGIVDGAPESPTLHTVVGVLSYPAPSFPFGRTPVVVNRHTSMVYVAAGNALHIIDGNPASPTFNTFVAHIPLLPTPTTENAYALDVNPTTGRVYVRTTDYQHSTLVTIDGATMSTLSAMEVPGNNWGWAMVDAGSRRVFVNAASTWPYFPLTILRDEVEQTASVPTGGGTPVTVSTQAATLVLSNVSSAGSVTLHPIDPDEVPLNLPGQFAIEDGLAYEVSTTASISGAITLCFNVSQVVDPVLFAALRVLHGENGSWVDRTSSRNYTTGTICAVTQSLSPFVVGHLDVLYGVRKLYDDTRAVRAGATLPLKIQLRGPLAENLSAADIFAKATGLKKVSNATTATVQDAGHANPDGDFRFDQSLDGGGYVFNLRTTGLSSGTYELTFVATGDSTQHALTFQVR